MSIAIRETFGREVVKLAKKNKKILALTADLKNATKIEYFFNEFPLRSFEIGIAEANCVGIATGLALSGYRPIVTSFGSFLTGKNVEIRVSTAFNNAPVILVGTHGGLIGPDGPTQSGLQDISVMRSIPNIKVFQPATNIETAAILKHCLKINDPIYLRISRQANKEYLKKNYVFKEGQPVEIIKDYRDAVLFCSGNTVERCVDAANLINKKFKIKVGVVNIPSIKPLNSNALCKILNNTKLAICFEDHSTYGGLGSAIIESVSKFRIKTPVILRGINVFTESGSINDLYKKYKLDEKSIFKIVLKEIKNYR
jgi:transketolase